MKTLTKEISHIEATRQQDKNQVEQVCTLLSWTSEQYCEFQFASYMEFILRMFKDWPEMAKQVASSAIFRGFWNNEVAFRNQTEFLPFATDMTSDLWEVDESGDLVITDGLTLGDCGLVNEFTFLHSPSYLMNDDMFMFKYNNVLKLLRKDLAC